MVGKHGAGSLVDAETCSVDAIRRLIQGLRAISLQNGRFCLKDNARCRGFVFVDQPLQLRRKFRISSAYRKAFEEKRAFVELRALQLPERFLVRLFHHASPASRRPSAILDPNSAQARQEKPVNHSAEDGSARRRQFRTRCGDDNPVAPWREASLRESVWQTRQMALDVSRPLTPSRS